MKETENVAGIVTTAAELMTVVGSGNTGIIMIAVITKTATAKSTIDLTSNNTETGGVILTSITENIISTGTGMVATGPIAGRALCTLNAYGAIPRQV